MAQKHRHKTARADHMGGLEPLVFIPGGGLQEPFGLGVLNVYRG